MSKLSYSATGEGRFMPLDQAIEQAEEGGFTEVHEYRPPIPSDVDFDSLTDSCWEWLDECLMDDEFFAWEDGCAQMVERFNSAGKGRKDAWYALQAALAEVVKEHACFDDAAWQKVRTLSLDDARELLSAGA